jgi:hypothetical protein
MAASYVEEDHICHPQQLYELPAVYRPLEHWFYQSKGRNDHVFGHEYTKGCIEIGATLGSRFG